MLNERFQDRPAFARFRRCHSSVVAGDPVIFGASEVGVAIDDYNADEGGTGFRFSGTFDLTVIAATTVSPTVGSACVQGDKLYAAGTTDSGTNSKYDLVISKDSSGVLVGDYDSSTNQTSGTTATSPVKLKETV